MRARAPVEGGAPGAALPGADGARGRRYVDLDGGARGCQCGSGRGGRGQDRGRRRRLAGRFVDLLRLVAFARTDIITTRGGAAALPADAAGKSTATGSASRTRSKWGETSAPSSRGGRRRSSAARDVDRGGAGVRPPTRPLLRGRFRSWLPGAGEFITGFSDCFLRLPQSQAKLGFFVTSIERSVSYGP